MDFTTLDPEKLSGASQCKLQNLVNGEWADTEKYTDIIDPLNGETMILMPNTSSEELAPFVENIKKVPKTGLHNPLKNPEKYNMWGNITFKAAAALDTPEVAHFFAILIQRVCPKSYAQALGEVNVVKKFLMNFCSDNVRYLAKGFHVPGDHSGQRTQAFRWPYGSVAIIAPFNFPLEIPVLQLMGAFYMGNFPTLKCASTTSIVMEMYVRLLLKCGMPKDAMQLIHCGGRRMSELIMNSGHYLRMTQFTGGCDVAESLAALTKGKIKVEDAGFDWKVLGPDVRDVDYVAWQCDQDAYALSGQKCSAESILFVHKNWIKVDLYSKLKRLAERRNMKDLSIGSVLSHTTKQILDHVKKVLELDGSKLLFGGEKLEGHSIPEKYGAVKPTAVFVPLKEILKNDENFELCTTEIFGPFQIVTEYDDSDTDKVIEALEKMEQHLTAAVVSNDANFLQKILSATVNGTTYCGIRARTTGAPQNHWFGPAGDPRGAGIGTYEAIRLVWSCQREIIEDFGPIPDGWKEPVQT